MHSSESVNKVQVTNLFDNGNIGNPFNLTYREIFNIQKLHSTSLSHDVADLVSIFAMPLE